jgi:hypothetical protein
VFVLHAVIVQMGMGMLSFTGVEGVDFLSAFGILAATNMVNDWGVMVPTAMTMRKMRYGASNTLLYSGEHRCIFHV